MAGDWWLTQMSAGAGPLVEYRYRVFMGLGGRRASFGWSWRSKNV